MMTNLLGLIIPFQTSASPQIMNVVFIFGLLIIFFVFMILPQQKKQKRQKKFLEGLSKGDHVVTMGGLHGKVSSMDEHSVTLEVDRGTKLRFEKSFISQENSVAIKSSSSK